jgi:hypothetical protein
MKTTNPKLDKDFGAIVDCISGSDGGVSFVRLQGLIEEMERRANAGDVAADKVLGAVYQFARLIEVANRK